jgi:hypothetical protein
MRGALTVRIADRVSPNGIVELELTRYPSISSQAAPSIVRAHSKRFCPSQGSGKPLSEGAISREPIVIRVRSLGHSKFWRKATALSKPIT